MAGGTPRCWPWGVPGSGWGLAGPRGDPALSTPLLSPRSPPRPSPGSLHYSDEDVTKYNDLIPAESSSLTEKPSEVSDSQVPPRGLRTGTGKRRAEGLGDKRDASGVPPRASPRSLPGTTRVPLCVWGRHCRSRAPSCVEASPRPRGTAPAGSWHSPRPVGTAGDGTGTVPPARGRRVGDCPAARSLVATAVALPTPQNATFVSSPPGRSQPLGRPRSIARGAGCWEAAEKRRLKPGARSWGSPRHSPVPEQGGDWP